MLLLLLSAWQIEDLSENPQGSSNSHGRYEMLRWDNAACLGTAAV
jgi:hypothetical protein